MAKIILDLRKADKLAGTYFSNFLKMNADGILHPSIKTLGARTGRMSMTNPALQTLPKGEATVRDAFIPYEGHALISCDYSQVEMRLMAHFSEDERLIGAFLDADAAGGDFFVSIGKDIYQDPDFNKKDKRRGLVKNTMYGKAYGAGKKKMAETAGVPYNLMSAVVDQIDASYPGLKGFAGKVEDIGFRREREEGEGYVLTPFGRRLPCDSGRVYSLVNYLLQGHAAEVLKDALVRLDHSGYGDYMLLPVHDEVIFSLPKEEVKDAMHEIPEIMGVTGGQYKVPLLADCEGPLARWGDKYREKAAAQPLEQEMITA
jgi:DNA polymerase-1